MKLNDLRKLVASLEDADGDLDVVVQDPENGCRLLSVDVSSELAGWSDKGKWSSPNGDDKNAILLFVCA